MKLDLYTDGDRGRDRIRQDSQDNQERRRTAMNMIISNAQMLTLNVGAAMIGIGAALVAAGVAFEWIRSRLHKSQPDEQAKH